MENKNVVNDNLVDDLSIECVLGAENIQSNPVLLIKDTVYSTEDNSTIKIEYINRRKIGEGTFGKVYKISINNKEYALKIVYEKSDYINRELEILRMLNHKNVIRILYYSYNQNNFIYAASTPEEKGVYLYIYMEYIKNDLLHLIKKKYLFNRKEYILYALSLLEGVEYLHSLNIAHRDIKPSNVLIDIEREEIKICDLGSAKQMDPEGPNVNYICSRCYRAPEIIKGNNYGTQVDIWSIGCILAEMLTHKILFKGESGEEILKSIIRKEKKLYTEILHSSKRWDMKDIIWIIKGLLTVSPEDRPTATQAKEKFLQLYSKIKSK
ncbi:glycogen synthase kinase 3 beta [Nematocida sp. AWRm80]|nr:glycogen synthase kinase 3 beta [Nematocida sp. AWRm80]